MKIKLNNNSKIKINSLSSPKNKIIKSTTNLNSEKRNLINTSKILLKKNKSTINLKSKEKKLNNKCVINKIKIINKEKNMSISSENSKNNTQRKSPILNINKFDLISKKCKTQKKLSKRIIDKSLKKGQKNKNIRRKNRIKSIKYKKNRRK